MSRALTALIALLCLGLAGCGEPGPPADRSPGVRPAGPQGAGRALAAWSAGLGQAPFAPSACSGAAGSGLDDCRLGVAGDRAIVVGRLGTAVFRIACPAPVADRLAEAQASALHG